MATILRYFILPFVILFFQKAAAQVALPNATTYSVGIAIPDPTIIAYITPLVRKPIFTQSGINTIFNQYTVSEFKQAYPQSKYQYLRQIYSFTTNSLTIGAQLKASYPNLFYNFYEDKKATPLAAYTPNDWNSNTLNNLKYLKYINAEEAWGITKGDPSIIIGVTDSYFDIQHEDLKNKIFKVRANTIGTLPINHGTQTAGLIAGETDNHIGLPAIGFNCKLDVSSTMSLPEMLTMSNDGDRILNGSWMNAYDLDINNSYMSMFGIFNNLLLCNEIYENGTFNVFSAGDGMNGKIPILAQNYVFPASFDHVFSVSNICVGSTSSSSFPNYNNVDCFETYVGTPINNMQFNDRVDLLAPGVDLTTLNYDNNNPNNHNLYSYSDNSGSSYSAPLVAGTAGLLLSENSCLSPYQLEYILKTSAKKSVLQKTENLLYAGKIGDGALNAEVAVQMADPDNNHIYSFTAPARKIACNDAATQTFTIEGVEVNTLCAFGLVNGLIPQLTPILKNGTGHYTYRWSPVYAGTDELDDYASGTPIIKKTGLTQVDFLLTVTDNSSVPKVASKLIHIKFITDPTKYDLAMRDSYFDMMNEPNDQYNFDKHNWQVWESPDIWNRQLQDGITEHQNPEYFNVNPNYLYTKIRNIGCAESPSNANLRLYWTKASTGENWKKDWDGNTTLTGASGTVLGGTEITNFNGTNAIPIPAILPGTSQILNSPWFPPKPQDFLNAPISVDVCVLARIEETSTSPFGMTIPEVTNQSITQNVVNNNNIVTRNLIVTNFNLSDRHSYHQFDVANAENTEQYFNLQLINEKDINKHLAGNFSEIGTITVHLGDLYDRWVAGGKQGVFNRIDPESKSITFDASYPIELQNIRLNPQERFPVDINFDLNEGASLIDASFLIHCRQFIKTEDNSHDDVYGNVSFKINCSTKDPNNNKGNSKSTHLIQTTGFKIYPNPTNQELTIQYLDKDKIKANLNIVDVLGKELIKINHQELSVNEYKINVNNLASGMYFLQITPENGHTERYKFIKE